MTLAKATVLAHVPPGWSLAQRDTYQPENIDVGRDIAPPDHLRLLELSETDYRIQQTISRKRGKDLSDPSPSGYDMALASLLGGIAGVSDQEIIDLCIWARSINGEDTTKCRRADYWERTLRRARSRQKPTEEAEPEEHRDVLSEMFGVYSITFVKYNSQPAVYSMIIQPTQEDEPFEYRIGGAGKFLDRKPLAVIWIDAMRRELPIGQQQWRGVVDRILASLEIREMDGEGSDAEAARGLLNEYLGAPHIHPGELGDDRAIGSGRPLLEGDAIYIHAPSVLSWASLHGWRVDRPSFLRGLRSLGGKSTVLNVIEPRKTTRSYYVVPLATTKKNSV